MTKQRSILWFRRDLRLTHHQAMAKAGRDGREVAAVFVLDPRLMRTSGAPRMAFMLRALRALNDDLGGALIVRIGDPTVVVPKLAGELGADEVHVTRDYAPYGRQRDGEVAERLAQHNSRLVGTGSAYLVAPGTVRKPDATPYAVFTPFFRTWTRELELRPRSTPGVLPRWIVDLATDELPDDPQLGCTLPEASSAAALARWNTFVGADLDRYKRQRDLPGVDGTSAMSPYLRWGIVHPDQLLGALGPNEGGETFLRELAWRDFYADVLASYPESARRNLRTSLDTIQMDTDEAAQARFRLWCAGETGYGLVDAGMRQLLATGWMHNRVRMVVASFLVKDLHLPWQWGARHFMRHLVDGDLASNQHGWQWAAGTGTDAAPYFRVFNPDAQRQRWDPEGLYVSRWAPDSDLLTPMVDHSVERQETLKRYHSAMGR